jgi:hypothetical protein
MRDHLRCLSNIAFRVGYSSTKILVDQTKGAEEKRLAEQGQSIQYLLMEGS